MTDQEMIEALPMRSPAGAPPSRRSAGSAFRRAEAPACPGKSNGVPLSCRE